MSAKDEICVCLYDEGFLQWVCGLIERSIKVSTKAPIHSFCLDFGSALLANCLHSYSVLEKLEKNQRLLGDLLLRLLQYLKQGISTSVLIHVLICLSYLSKERFSIALEDCSFVERISEFVEWYTVNFTGGQD